MSSLVTTVRHLILRELDAFKREIQAFPDDAGPWVAPDGVTNTAGTLALHVAGNLQHFIGAGLGQTGYVRHRDEEFSKRGISRSELVAELDRARAAVDATLAKLTDERLPEVYPEPFGGKNVNTDAMLLHLAIHLGYHLGQADYHRRITTGTNTAVDAVAAREVPPVR
jgi:uncharacterized damage-inducible protein DinB